MEVKYSPVSMIAYACGTAATAAASANPITVGAAAGLGAVAEALFGGVEIEGDEKNMRNTLLRTIDRAWDTIQKKYNLTDPCMTELREEVMGKSTAVDSFIRNSQSQGLNSAMALVIEGILLKHVGEFKRSPKYTWTRAYTKNASKNIANILIDSIEGVLKTNDSLMILKAIMDGNAQMRQGFQDISNQLDQLQQDIEHKGAKETDIQQCLTAIPAVNRTVGLIGRDSIAKTVRELLEKNDRTALVNGLGGIGKTAVMQYVCSDLKNEGKYVAWIECGRNLKEDLLLLRTALGIPGSDDEDRAYEKILYELQANRQLASNLYLFLDNLSHVLSDEEQEDLNGLGIHVMATSRFEHEYFENVPLDVLVEDSALDMFYGYYLEKQKDKKRRYMEAAKEIIESVQSHTMLVELLAKAAWKKGGTLEAFRDDLKEQGVLEVFKRKLNTKHDKNRTIEECVIELYKISGLTPAQQHIMKLFTIFTSERVIYYKIAEWADLEMDAMDGLVELGWLDRGGPENGYHIHQIVKDSLTSQLKKDNEKVRLEDYGDFLKRVIGTKDYLSVTETYEVVRERIGLTEDVAGYLWDEYQMNPEKDEAWAGDAGELMNNLAGVYREQGEYEKALEYYGKALDIRENVLGSEHLDTASTYNNVAGVYLDQGNYEKALDYYAKARAIVERMLGREHLAMAPIYNNMAGVYRELGDYEKALKYFGKALDIKENVLGTEHPNTATTYNNIAMIYNAQGNYEKALEYYSKTIPVVARVLGTENPYMAFIYVNMAMVYKDQGDYEKALEYNSKALAIEERVLGTEHPSTATTYNNMAVVYREQGDYEKALEYYKKANAVFFSVFGEQHSYTQNTQRGIEITERSIATGMTEDELMESVPQE